jgi:hypothetical protein
MNKTRPEHSAPAFESDQNILQYKEDSENPNSIMHIGYITKKHSAKSEICRTYISELKKSLEQSTVG